MNKYEKLEQYLKTCTTKNSKSTIQSKQSILKQYLKHTQQEPPNTTNYKTFLKNKKQEGVSPDYLNLCGMTIKQYLQYLGQNTENLPLPKREGKTRKGIPEEEIITLLQANPYNEYPQEHIIILFLLNTGLRVSELCNLKYKDINTNKRRLTVTKAKGNQKRTIPLNTTAIQMIQQQTQLQQQKNIKSEYIFSNQKGNKISTRYIQMQINKAGKRAGIKVSPHLFRHTFATISNQKGLDSAFLQKILGHSTLSITEKYLHHDLGIIQEKYDEININIG